MLPPGRLRLSTRPLLTGILAAYEDDWDGRRHGLGHSCRGAIGDDGGYLAANEIGREFRQQITLIVRVAPLAPALLRRPITGIAGCCARPASGG